MKLNLQSKQYRLFLKHPFTISRSTRTHQDTVILSISDGVTTGYGEAIPYPYYNITYEKIEQSVAKSKSIVENAFGMLPNDLWSYLEPNLKDNYFTLCAINCAYWDYYAKSQNRTTRSYFCDENKSTPLSDYTIGIDTIDIMKQKILDTPWPIYKIKLGTEHDVEIISELRNITDAIFRIDANCAWTVEETLQNAIQLKNLGVEFIEQPLKAEDWESMKRLKRDCVLPLIADESCQRLEDVQKCAEGFHGINIKLMKCGGLTPALKMIEKAGELNLKVMAGCMAESTVGISNLAQIASLLDYIDADGAMLLKNDTANGIKLDYGKIVYPEIKGSGISLL
ncbi:dipeptide epimerase [Flavobacteriaceae bacterium S0825]|uniref:dipeptide epimerase n=1 Tax=Gaetbulibacter sp. S0825 TaxID=2720084 RepID=UPI00142FC341|nr:dipeptide epimerase [Gaetbulibacter sp. S0825]MCK0108844.1 dipeptide epimerase [Flavobacteriaceae bacterium S0825]NIX64480.1 dipeptide epimerase [Gaetbulibacter sp. S0825]